MSKILKESKSAYSISRVGYSICITLGEPKYGNNYYNLLVPADLNNFMEILPDGSVRGRIVFTAPPGGNNSNVVTTGTISMVYSFFKDVYSSIFNDKYHVNFIEAKKYEKLIVLKMFEPKILTNPSDEYYKKFEQFSEQHKNKYGSNIIINSNRTPMNDFYVIDKKGFQDRKIKYNDENLFNELFGTSYFLLGYIDKLKITGD